MFHRQPAAYALGSTTIDLCLSLFPWATFRRAKAAIKLHTLLTLQGNFPTVISVSTGSVHDVHLLDQLVWEAGSFYIMDRGYLDFARWQRIHQCGAFFVTRAKQNFRCVRRYSRPVDKTTGLRFDQTVVLTGLDAQHNYPAPLRRVGYRDPETGKMRIFLTHNFIVPARTIAQLDRGRWQIELSTSNGSSSICASKPFTARRPTRGAPKSAVPLPFTCSSPF